MIYSVYSYDRRAYDYYEAPGPGGAHAGAPPAPLLRGIAAAPEAATWKLPAGAKKVGSGEMPRGRIASAGSVLGLGDLPTDLPTIGLVVGVVYLAWRNLR